MMDKLPGRHDWMLNVHQAVAAIKTSHDKDLYTDTV